METAQIAGRALGLAPGARDGLEEQHRDGVPLMDDASFHRAVERALREPDRLSLGEETASQAEARFASALEALLEEGGSSRPAVVSHGTVVSLYAARVAGVDALELWRRLGMPACVTLTYPGPELGEVIEEVR